MRAIIDEFGQLMITLIVASAVLVVLIFGTTIPQMKNHAENVISDNTFTSSSDYSAVSAVILRPAPTLVAPPLIIDANALVSFDECITNGIIKAINADGTDLNDKIKIEPFDTNATRFYNENTRVFQSAEAGDYKFIVSVKDITDANYFGKETKIITTITVKAAS